VKPQLNHLPVWARDRHAAATFFAEIVGLGPPTGYDHFVQVETGNGVTIDFADTDSEPPIRLGPPHRDSLTGTKSRTPPGTR